MKDKSEFAGISWKMDINQLFTIDCGEILLIEFRIKDVNTIFELFHNRKLMNFCQIDVQ